MAKPGDLSRGETGPAFVALKPGYTALPQTPLWPTIAIVIGNHPGTW